MKNIRYTSVRGEIAEMLEFYYLRVAQAHPEARTAQSSQLPKDLKTMGTAPDLAVAQTVVRRLSS
jgi:hypothetical protein